MAKAGPARAGISRTQLRRWCVACLLSVPVILAHRSSFAENAGSRPGGDRIAAGPDTIITVGTDQTIRDISRQYLGDPDLWPAILKASGLPPDTIISPGQTLHVPTASVASAVTALAAALQKIQAANGAGAQLFAPDEIAQAVETCNHGLQQRAAGNWSAARDEASQAQTQADAALRIAQARREEAAEALLSDRAGVVEGQKPRDISWGGLSLRAILIEEQKVRTLSESTAQLTFRDAARLRLDANSNAVIRRLRYDPLNRHQDAKVSLTQGDFYALLPSGDTHKSLEVEVPDVKATVESGDFWVSSSPKAAKFTNYDDRPVAVSARGGTLTLGRDEGTVVMAGRQPDMKQTVLPEPSPAAPPSDGTIYGTVAELAWTPVATAAGYWLEIAGDQGFDRVVTSRFGLDRAAYRADGLKPGQYYWRVAALDQFGLPGRRSMASRFVIRLDTTPPFVQVDEPREGVIVRDRETAVTGITETGASITVDSRPVMVGADGRFTTHVALTPGVNEVAVAATDAAGNITHLGRAITCMPDRDVGFAFDAALPRRANGSLLAAGTVLALSGTTAADAAVTVTAADGSQRAAAASDGAGRFRLDLPVQADAEQFVIAAVTVTGFTVRDRFEVAVDHSRPVITLADDVPRVTATPALTLRGQLDKPALLQLNDRPVEVRDNSFTVPVTLQDGSNVLEFKATDVAGHIAVERVEILLHRTPPRLLRTDLDPDRSGTGVVGVAVTAEDESGLASTASVTVLAGGSSYAGRLRLNAVSGTYQGTISVPAVASRQARVSSVELTDRAGNTGTYRLN